MHGKKIILLATSCLVLLLPLIAYWQYNILHKHYQQTVVERLSHNSTETLTLATHNIVWIKPNKEILIKGRYFDTKKIETVNDSTTVTGWYDDEDSDLAANYNQVKHKQKRAKQNLIKVFAFEYATYLEQSTPKYLWSKTAAQPNIFISKNCATFYHIIYKPPMLV